MYKNLLIVFLLLILFNSIFFKCSSYAEIQEREIVLDNFSHSSSWRIAYGAGAWLLARGTETFSITFENDAGDDLVYFEKAIDPIDVSLYQDFVIGWRAMDTASATWNKLDIALLVETDDGITHWIQGWSYYGNNPSTQLTTEWTTLQFNLYKKLQKPFMPFSSRIQKIIIGLSDTEFGEGNSVKETEKTYGIQVNKVKLLVPEKPIPILHPETPKATDIDQFMTEKTETKQNYANGLVATSTSFTLWVTSNTEGERIHFYGDGFNIERWAGTQWSSVAQSKFQMPENDIVNFDINENVSGIVPMFGWCKAKDDGSLVGSWHIAKIDKISINSTLQANTTINVDYFIQNQEIKVTFHSIYSITPIYPFVKESFSWRVEGYSGPYVIRFHDLQMHASQYYYATRPIPCEGGEAEGIDFTKFQGKEEQLKPGTTGCLRLDEVEKRKYSARLHGFAFLTVCDREKFAGYYIAPDAVRKYNVLHSTQCTKDDVITGLRVFEPKATSGQIELFWLTGKLDGKVDRTKAYTSVYFLKGMLKAFRKIYTVQGTPLPFEPWEKMKPKLIETIKKYTHSKWGIESCIDGGFANRTESALIGRMAVFYIQDGRLCRDQSEIKEGKKLAEELLRFQDTKEGFFYMSHNFVTNKFDDWDGCENYHTSWANAESIWHTYRLYKLTGDMRYLESVQKGLDFVIRMVKRDGTIYVHYTDTLQPSVKVDTGYAGLFSYLLLKFYEETKENIYKEVGLKLIEHWKEKETCGHGVWDVYYDDENFEKRWRLSPSCGAPIMGAYQAYKITKDKTYLLDAQRWFYEYILYCYPYEGGLIDPNYGRFYNVGLQTYSYPYPYSPKYIGKHAAMTSEGSIMIMHMIAEALRGFVDDEHLALFLWLNKSAWNSQSYSFKYGITRFEAYLPTVGFCSDGPNFEYAYSGDSWLAPDAFILSDYLLFYGLANSDDDEIAVYSLDLPEANWLQERHILVFNPTAKRKTCNIRINGLQKTKSYQIVKDNRILKKISGSKLEKSSLQMHLSPNQKIYLIIHTKT